MPSTFIQSLLAIASLSSVVLAAPAYPVIQARSTPGSKHVIANLFQWNWDSVAKECAWLGKNGYGFVQVSPASEHIQGAQWWTDYQVVSYKLQSKRGNADQFRNMVNACKTAGVGVIVDIVWNHMAGIDGGVGVAGSSFSHYNYPGIYDKNDFHYCGTPGNDIQNWSDRTQVQTCELSNLADLKTEASKVRNTLLTHTNSLIDLGVAGFRVDASKHIPTTDIKYLLAKVKKQGLYYTHEVVYEGGAGVTSSEYIAYGDVQEFRYTTLLSNAFNSGNIAQLQGLKDKGWLPSDKANVFVVNHDRERGGYLSYKSPSKRYTLAHVFSLAYPYGTPTVFSGYSFSNNDDGAPNGNYGTCNDNGSGANGWQCQHRWAAIAGMVNFYNKVGSNPLKNWKQGDNNQIAFGRGNVGYVIINNSDNKWKTTFTTGLPDGKYCDVITGKKSGSSCTGKIVTVKGGKLTNYGVGQHNSVAIHTGAKL
ncbi:hypothetical protein FRC04_009040 [Tulasnella sp. 424]|nr:hypothetical protein FRC04_009040 [Tulasnella sp. 424]KAG8973510.1 hypothetical protein FRC05_008681 [Tulasnella sp. 425]